MVGKINWTVGENRYTLMNMKKVWNVVKEVFLWIWQIPQNLVGLVFMLFLFPVERIREDTIAKVYKSHSMSGGISLGNYAFVSRSSSKDDKTIRHEGIGHPKQSLYLGPLYLVVIGLPSLIWAALYGSVVKSTKNGYYKFYTERWADKLAGITRDFN